MIKIHREGWGIIATVLAVFTVINFVLYSYYPQPIFHVVSIISIILFVFCCSFFRSPFREFEGESEGAIIAPADGKIVAIEEVYEPAYFKENRIQVSIFMSVFNVHANWYPMEGTVTHSSHQDGRFMAAYLPKSSTENERSTVAIRNKQGVEIMLRQVAGAVARRIVTYAKAGDQAQINRHLGFIKFGSRVDIYLPLDSEILVKLNDKTTGNETVIARLK